MGKVKEVGKSMFHTGMVTACSQCSPYKVVHIDPHGACPWDCALESVCITVDYVSTDLQFVFDSKEHCPVDCPPHLSNTFQITSNNIQNSNLLNEYRNMSNHIPGFCHMPSTENTSRFCSLMVNTP